LYSALRENTANALNETQLCLSFIFGRFSKLHVLSFLSRVSTILLWQLWRSPVRLSVRHKQVLYLINEHISSNSFHFLIWTRMNLVFVVLPPLQNSKGNHHSEDGKYTGCENFSILDWNRAVYVYRKRYSTVALCPEKK